jgi:ribosomal protein S26
MKQRMLTAIHARCVPFLCNMMKANPKPTGSRGVEASIYCDECGDAYPVDWQRKEMEGFYEAEFVDPKDDGELTDAERNA